MLRTITRDAAAPRERRGCGVRGGGPDLLLMYSALGRGRRKPVKRYMKKYRVWHKSDPALTTMVMAEKRSQAANRVFLNHRYQLPDGARYIDMRTSLVAVLYPMGAPAPAEELFALTVMRHALGLNQYGGGNVYRNHYASYRTSADHDQLMTLVNRDVPLLGVRPVEKLAAGMVYFHVTLAGKEWCDKRLGLKSEA